MYMSPLYVKSPDNLTRETGGSRPGKPKEHPSGNGGRRIYCTPIEGPFEGKDLGGNSETT